MKNLLIGFVGAVLTGAGVLALTAFGMDAAVNGVLKDCMTLGGFRHEDKVYICTRVQAELVQPSAGDVELKFAEPR